MSASGVPLLATKLHVPEPRRGWVPRLRLQGLPLPAA